MWASPPWRPGAQQGKEHCKKTDGSLASPPVRLSPWGSARGFDWANRHRHAVKGLAYMEALVRPLTWDEWHPAFRPIFQALRSEAGEAMVLEQIFFVEVLLPRAILRPLTAGEMAEYRRPFAEPGEGRRLTVTWPRQIPLDGEPADVAEIVRSYATGSRTAACPSCS